MKENDLVDVATEDDIVCMARVVKDRGETVDVQLLVPVARNTFSFNDTIENVPSDAILGFYDTDNIEKTGMYRMTNKNTYEELDYESASDSDQDFVPDEYDSEDDDDVSLVDEDEDEDDDEDE